MRGLNVALALAIAVVAAGCGGSDGNSSDEAIIKVSERWADAYATNDADKYCQYETGANLCRTYLGGGKPTVYQTGYLNATVENISRSGHKALVTLNNGCKIELTDQGAGHWLVSNHGGSPLADNCEQGTGR